jgi:hypothetical protein
MAATHATLSREHATLSASHLKLQQELQRRDDEVRAEDARWRTEDASAVVVGAGLRLGFGSIGADADVGAGLTPANAAAAAKDRGVVVKVMVCKGCFGDGRGASWAAAGKTET